MKHPAEPLQENVDDEIAEQLQGDDQDRTEVQDAPKILVDDENRPDKTTEER